MLPKGRNLAVTFLSLTLLLPMGAAAQSQPPTEPPVTPQAVPRDARACAEAKAEVRKDGEIDVQNPRGRTLSEQLAQSDGVICPPARVDPEMRKPAPDVGRMPVIPPPGSPGGDPTVRPK